MRQGKLVGVEETKNVNEKILASMMVGRDVLFDKMEKKGEIGDVMVEVDDLKVADNRGLLAVRGVSLKVRAGEILGIAAIEGNGQSELLEAITGMRHIEAGTIKVAGTDIAPLKPGQVRELGLAHIPEDRIATGVSSQSSITDNLIIGKERLPQFAKYKLHLKKSSIVRYANELFEKFDMRGAGVDTITDNLIIGKERLPQFAKYKLHLKKSSIVRYANELFEKFDMRGAGVDTKVGSLSGGNMQKVVVAREFSFDTPILIIAQPTRGVDVGAIEFIHQCIIDKRNEGCAILLVSADLDEVFRLSDRIITMYEGQITGEFKEGEIDKMGISYYMTGDRSTEQTGGEKA